MSRYRGARATLLQTVTVVIGAFALSLTGCVSANTAALPTGGTIDVYQSRIDYSEHKLEVAISNNTGMPFEVLALSFSSPVFVPAAVYDKAPTTVRAGTTTDFRLLIPLADCAATSAVPRVKVKFTFDGTAGEASLVPNDRMNQLPSIAAEDCREREVAAISTITPAPELRYTTVEGTTAAVLDFTAIPTGLGGKLTIDSVRGTVLLAIRDPVSGKAGDAVPLWIDAGRATAPVGYLLA